MELYEKSAHELSAMLRNRECSSEEITRSVMDRAEATEDKVGAYLTLCREQALEKAREVDARLARETLHPLIGQPVSKQTAELLNDEIMSYDGIIGIHDLILHNYGSNNTFGSVHVEVPANCDILEIHDTIDTIEREIKRKFNISVSVHIDPVVTDDDFVNRMKDVTRDILKEIDETITFHDFRVVHGPTHTNFIFDIVLNHNSKFSESEITQIISD